VISRFAVAGIMSLLFFSSCESEFYRAVLTAVQSNQTPTVEIYPPPGSAITVDTSIRLTFSASMIAGTCELGGTLTVESDGGNWSSGVFADDTFVLAPQSYWSTGGGKTLTLGCTDTDGWQVPTIELSYGVLDGAVYVDATSGDDENPGTADAPKASIQAAIECAASLYQRAQVRIAEGRYVIPVPGAPIVLANGISLYGGYKRDWTERDPELYVTKVVASDSSAYTGGDGDYMILAKDVSEDTVIDGLMLASYVTTIRCINGSPQIQNCTVNSGCPTTLRDGAIARPA
jgi:hypothetical protein